ncbi:MAG: sel1 repeat family protein [Bacteroidetes bacterium SB0662_bin_6]|nr:sel1 repeat family protein [Bacteroidetes bacterium SB0668_bin_1]MYE03899.1 sel1 repeat family protein [Bacteroidetes bacterium SB0662_bin_6]
MKGSELDDYRRGKMYERGLGGFPQDFPKAMECFRRVADEQNHPGAQFTLSMMLFLKWLILLDDTDYEEGKKWLYRAEDQGFGEAVELKSSFDKFDRNPSPHTRKHFMRMLREYLGMTGMEKSNWRVFFEQMSDISP